MCHLLVRARSLRVLSGPTRQEPAAIGELMLILNLDCHRNIRVVGDTSRGVAGIALVKRPTSSGGCTVVLVVERWQVLPVLEHQRTLMTALLAGIDVVIVLVLHWRMLLLQLPLMLLHLLCATCIVSHVVEVHLLLNVHVVLGRGSLLLGLNHHLVTTHGLIRVDSVLVAVLDMLAAHGLAAIVHQEVALVMLPVLLVAA